MATVVLELALSARHQLSHTRVGVFGAASFFSSFSFVVVYAVSIVKRTFWSLLGEEGPCI
jgi:hypothetical protein